MALPLPQRRNGGARRMRWAIAAAAAAAAVALWRWNAGGGPESGVSFGGETTFAAVRGPLDITVLEGGAIEALESLEIKCEVQGSTKILTLVDEGHQITAEDVKNGLVLVELDSKELLDRLTESELEYQTALASLAEARESFEIQRNQNESDIKKAELDVKFARMDMEKYLGALVAGEILTARGIKDVETRFESNPAASAEAETPAPQEAASAEESETPVSSPLLALLANLPEVDFSAYADPERLGDGAARQELRKLENDLTLATQEVGLAETQVEGTKRLYDKDFVTKNELDNDELKLKRGTVEKESADTERGLFIKYEFPKEAEKLLSDYEESLRNLERTRRLAVSRLAQAEAKLNSAEARHALQRRKRDEIRTQIEKCTIRADREGLVVYGSGEDRWGDEDRIEEGAMVRERQIIITIPDTNKMGVRVRVHESVVKQVARGQKVRIRVDAYPDLELIGKVDKIAVLPDSANRWMNPDLKVYSTEVAIDGLYDWLKPGMNAQVEILVDRIDDAVQVPIQAVQRNGGEQVVYVAGLAGDERRPVVTGLYNTSMIEVKSGLETGEVVRLSAPDWEDAAPEEGEGAREPARDAPEAG